MSKSCGFGWFDEAPPSSIRHYHGGKFFTQFEDDPAASPLRKRYRHLGMAVLTRAINDAAGVGVVASDHPWTEVIDGKEVMAAWLKEKLRGLKHSDQVLAIRRMMIDDARNFLLSPEREDDRLVWFRAAGLGYPGCARMEELIASRRAMADSTVIKMREKGTSGGDVSSRAAKPSQPRKSRT